MTWTYNPLTGEMRKETGEMRVTLGFEPELQAVIDRIAESVVALDARVSHIERLLNHKEVG